jgi:hypothetical protein
MLRDLGFGAAYAPRRPDIRIFPGRLSGSRGAFHRRPAAFASRRPTVERSQTLWDKTIVLPPGPSVVNLKPTQRQIMAPPAKPFLPESRGAARKVLKVADAAPAPNP